MPDEPQFRRKPDTPYHPRPGDRLYRVPRITTRRIILPRIRPHRPVIGVSLVSLVYSFVILIALGTVLLMLPFSSSSGQWTPFVDSLFTATSAISITGLVVVDTLNYWSFFGQLIILIMIQVGGIGIMTFTTVLLMAAGRRIGLRGRILVGEAIGVPQIGGIIRLARNILFFTLAAELIGAAIFYWRFSQLYAWPESIWMSLFHAISAFNNAGFELLGNFTSITAFSQDYLFLFTTAVLIILGGISFVVIHNIYQSRGLRHSSIDTKLVLLISFILLALGTIVVFIMEYTNPQTLGTMSMPDKLANAFFESVTARSSGFSALNTASLTTLSLFVIMILMIIGGSTGSTAGGIKVNTVGLIAATIWSTLRGKEHPEAFGRELPVPQIFRGISLLVLALSLVALIFFILSIIEDFPPLDVLFETVSALGTVGLTTGITPELSIASKIIIALAMFTGRLGPLVLSMNLARAQQISKYRYPQDSVRIG